MEGAGNPAVTRNLPSKSLKALGFMAYVGGNRPLGDQWEKFGPL